MYALAKSSDAAALQMCFVLQVLESICCYLVSGSCAMSRAHVRPFSASYRKVNGSSRTYCSLHFNNWCFYCFLLLAATTTTTTTTDTTIDCDYYYYYCYYCYYYDYYLYYF